MCRFPFILGVVLGLCLMSEWSWAERAYVTDSFKITLRTGPSTENKIIIMLSSGQPLEVMDSRDDWSYVRLLENGEITNEGWVLSRFLITRLPWETRAASLIEENTRLKEKVTPLENELSDALRREQELAKKLQDATEALQKLKDKYESLEHGATDYLKLKATYTDTRSRLETIQKEIQGLSEENKRLKSFQRNRWFITGAAVLLCGLIIGLMLGRHQRKRRSSLSY